MGADVVLRWAADDSATGSLDVRYVNTSGTPLVSCVRRDLAESGYAYDGAYNGAVVADVYTLTFSGTTCYVNAALGTANPYHNPTTGVTIVKDGSSPNDLVVPGLRLVFSSGTGDTDTAVVSVGAYLSVGGVATKALNFGIQRNDGELVSFRAVVHNVGSSMAADVRLVPLPGSYYTGDLADTHVVRLAGHTDPDRARLAAAGSLTLTFDTWTNQGSYYTANVNVGGGLCIATAKFDGETVYEYGSGNGYVDASDYLKGLQVVFAKTTTDPTSDTLAVVVRDGWEWAMVAADTNGNAGTYQNTELSLGDLAAGATTHCWLGWLVPEGQARGAVRLWVPRLAYMEV
jgi:hypothetical protein